MIVLWYHVYASIDKGIMFGSDGPFSHLSEELKSNNTGMYIIFENIILLFHHTQQRNQHNPHRPPNTYRRPKLYQWYVDGAPQQRYSTIIDPSLGQCSHSCQHNEGKLK